MEPNTCAFTGHRPFKFPWKYDESDFRCAALKKALSEQIAGLIKDGVTAFSCGMALGTDLWAAKSVLAFRQKNPHLKLYCFLPFEGQADKWPLAAQSEYHQILSQADLAEYVCKDYHKGCMLERNRVLVDSAHQLLAVYNGEFRGGTAATIRYAQKTGREIIIIDPLSLCISYINKG